MKCLILAAGYATRLYPLTKNMPKALLEAGEKNVLEYIINDLEPVKEITEYIIITNHIFYQSFLNWSKKAETVKTIRILDDGSISNDTRLGAVKDLEYTVKNCGMKEDILVLAGDNLFDFSLKSFIDSFLVRRKNMIFYYNEKDPGKLIRTGVAEVSHDGRVLSMEEKPKKPKSNFAVPPCYLFRKEDLHLISQGISEGCAVDSPGDFLAWFCSWAEVFAIKMPGNRYDIGTIESYIKVQKLYKKNKTILVTGCAGFIGAALSLSLLKSGIRVIGFDNLNSYYDVELKKYRLLELEQFSDFTFIKGDLSDKECVESLFLRFCPDVVVHLGAQAGVRYSIKNPQAYMDSNMTGFFNILEACKNTLEEARIPVTHFIFASSSSVYGLQEKVPYSTTDNADRPVSLYAATKRSNELMAHAYSCIYGLKCTGLRFFTVYGPKGRPDMAYYSFTEKMIHEGKVALFNYGNLYRDFTYIDDIIEGIRKIMEKSPDTHKENGRYLIYNIGNSRPESLQYFVDTLEKILMEEKLLKEPIEKEYFPMQQGDVFQTYADMKDMEEEFHFKPSVNLEDGLRAFVRWYKEYKSRNEENNE